MRADVAADLSNSAQCFERIVWPAIKDIVGGGELQPVEAVTATGFAKDLDVLAGIDAWQIVRESHYIRGIASRVQWGLNSYDTFTIRMSRDSKCVTEYDKRIDALANADSGHLYPHFTCQAYLDNPYSGRLLGAAVIETKILFNAAKKLHELGITNKPYSFGGWGYRRPAEGGATFMCLHWDFLNRYLDGLPVKTLTTSDIPRHNLP